MDINVNDYVRFKKSVHKGDGGAIYRVKELNQDKVVLELTNAPKSGTTLVIAKLSDLKLIEKAA